MSLKLQTKQNQVLSQRMIQSVRILQMTSQQLENYIDELALENPAMDVKKAEGESIDAHQQAVMIQDEDSYVSMRQNNDDDFNPKDNWNLSAQDDETLKQFLLSQLDLRTFSPEELRTLNYLLENLDSRGYLTEEASFAAEQVGTTIEQAEKVIDKLQQCEPAGICARNLQECLKIQLAAAGCLDPALERILDECLELLAKNKYAAIAGKIGIPPAQVAQYAALIRSLDPKPGSRFFSHNDAQYIIPDVTITRSGEHFTLFLNSADCPRITINRYYQKFQRSTTDVEAKSYLEEKIRQIQWLQKCIEQRHSTLLKIAQEILHLQNSFFLHGPDHLVSMRLTDVADAVNMHESTVSRAIDQKYLQCDYGIYPLQYFFQRRATARDSRSVSIQDQDFTSSEIKRHLQEIIAEEDPKKPFSDRILCEKLEVRGINISRRTVAKYRNEAHIPDASGRKILY